MNARARFFATAAALGLVAALFQVGCATDGDSTSGKPKPGGPLDKPGGSGELCNENGSVRYRANQIRGDVIVIADGSHNRAGFKVFFERSPIEIFPPQFILKHKAPATDSASVITPFTETTSFRAGQKVDAVTVHDAKGKHVVKVDQAPD
jgi:hypothetical protein